MYLSSNKCYYLLYRCSSQEWIVQVKGMNAFAVELTMDAAIVEMVK